jgi:Arc/MetJ-type ribon-helix-helix transcriptional regulator
MTKNQEATIKISKHTLHDLRILKAEGSFKSYDSLIQEVVKQWLKDESK